MIMKLCDWCAVQPGWKFVQPMLHSGLYIRLHVVEPIPDVVIHPERRVMRRRFVVLQHPLSGGELCIEECSDASAWHIELVGDPSDVTMDASDDLVEDPMGGADVWH